MRSEIFVFWSLEFSVGSRYIVDNCGVFVEWWGWGCESKFRVFFLDDRLGKVFFGSEIEFEVWGLDGKWGGRLVDVVVLG